MTDKFYWFDFVNADMRGFYDTEEKARESADAHAVPHHPIYILKVVGESREAGKRHWKPE